MMSLQRHTQTVAPNNPIQALAPHKAIAMTRLIQVIRGETQPQTAHRFCRVTLWCHGLSYATAELCLLG